MAGSNMLAQYSFGHKKLVLKPKPTENKEGLMKRSLVNNISPLTLILEENDHDGDGGPSPDSIFSSPWSSPKCLKS